MCFLINHVAVGLISDTGDAAVNVQFKNWWTGRRNSGKSYNLWRPHATFESPSVGLALIVFSTSSCTPNMSTMKWNATWIQITTFQMELDKCKSRQTSYSNLFSGDEVTYNRQTKSKIIDLRVKSPTKPNTDLNNGDLKFPFFSFSDSACYHQVSSIMLNHHSIIHLLISLTLPLL